MIMPASLRSALAVVIRAGVLAALGSTATLANDAQSLERHRDLWREAAVDPYVYAYHKFCECYADTPPETHVTVRDGVVIDVRHQPFGFEHFVQAEARNFEWYWTIDQLFDLVGNALDRGAVVRVEYDAARGYPTHVFIDHDEDLIGDEVDVRVTRLERLEE